MWWPLYLGLNLHLHEEAGAAEDEYDGRDNHGHKRARYLILAVLD